MPQRGAVTIETLHDGDLLGWSWLVPPYRTVFDARAIGPVARCAFDGRCLRGKCEADPSLGYDAAQALRRRDRRAPPGHPAPAAGRLRQRRSLTRPPAADGPGQLAGRAPDAARPRDTWTLDLEPRTRARCPLRAGAVRDALRLRRRRGADLGQRRPDRPGPLVHTIRAVGAVTARSAQLRPGHDVGVRGPFGTAWPVAEAEGRDVVIVAGGIGLAPLRPVVLPPARATASATAGSWSSTAARAPAELLYPGRARALARALRRRRSRSPSDARRAGLARTRRRGDEADPAAPTSIRRARSPWSAGPR